MIRLDDEGPPSVELASIMLRSIARDDLADIVEGLAVVEREEQAAEAAALCDLAKVRMLIEAIRAITVDIEIDGEAYPNGPTERAMLELEAAVRRLRRDDPAFDDVRYWAREVCAESSRDAARLRATAEGALGGNFRTATAAEVARALETKGQQARGDRAAEQQDCGTRRRVRRPT